MQIWLSCRQCQPSFVAVSGPHYVSKFIADLQAMAFIHGHENETWHAASMHEVGSCSCCTRRLPRMLMRMLNY